MINYLSSEQQAAETVAEIKAKGGEAIAVKGDMSKDADVLNLISATQQAFGKEIHILVNVAGGMVARKQLTDMDADFWDFVMALNVKSAFLAYQACITVDACRQRYR